MLNLLEYKEFFEKAEFECGEPYISQVNKDEDMIGWCLAFDGENGATNLLCDDGKVGAWLSLDDLIGAVFESYGMYFETHVYYAGEKIVNLPSNIKHQIAYGVMAQEPVES